MMLPVDLSDDFEENDGIPFKEKSASFTHFIENENNSERFSGDEKPVGSSAEEVQRQGTPEAADGVEEESLDVMEDVHGDFADLLVPDIGTAHRDYDDQRPMVILEYSCMHASGSYIICGYKYIYIDIDTDILHLFCVAIFDI